MTASSISRGTKPAKHALDRLGAAGLTRVFVRPGTALAAELKARGLVDEEIG